MIKTVIRLIIFFLMLNSALAISKKSISDSLILSYERKGEKYLEKNEIDKAELIYRKLLGKMENSKGYIGLSAVYMEKKEYDKAIEYSLKALELQKKERKSKGGSYDINIERDRLKVETVIGMALYRKGEYEQSFDKLFKIYAELYDVYREENIEKFLGNLINLNEKISETDIILYNRNKEKIQEMGIEYSDKTDSGRNIAEFKKKKERIKGGADLYNEDLPYFPSAPSVSSADHSSSLQKEHELKNVIISGNNVKISTEKAKMLAFENAKVERKKIRITKLLLEKEDREYIYNMIFFTEYKKYEYKIDANTGKIIKNTQVLRKIYADKTKPKGFLGIF